MGSLEIEWARHPVFLCPYSLRHPCLRAHPCACASIGSTIFSGLRGMGQSLIGEPATFHPINRHSDNSGKLHGVFLGGRQHQ